MTTVANFMTSNNIKQMRVGKNLGEPAPFYFYIILHHSVNLSVKNNIVHQRVGKILKFTSRIKRSPPREWEGEELRSNEGVGLSHDRESRAKRRGGAKRGNLCDSRI